MGKKPETLITAVDLGSAKTFVVVAEASETGLVYRGHGMHESHGTRRGAIVDLEKAAAGVRAAAQKAEDAAGAPVESAVVGVGGAHVRGINCRGGVTLGSRPREITREDIRAAVEKARSVALPAEWQIMHLLPQQFIVDERECVRDPAGMMGTKLEVQVHAITSIATVTQNIVTVLNRAGMDVQDTVFEPLAAAECVLRADERELGVCLLDLGAGSSELIVYHEGVVAHSGVLSIGGDHFTSDLAVGLRTPLAEAERLKRNFGAAVVTRVPDGNEVEVPAVGDRPSRLMPQRFLAEVLEPRASELFEHLRDHLRQAGVLELCGAGLVLTGGGARLQHIAEIAEQVLRRPARVARPTPMTKLPGALAEADFSTALGLAFYGNRARFARQKEEAGLGGKIRSFLARASM